MENTPQNLFNSLAILEVENYDNLLNSIITFDIFFKRSSAGVFKKVYPKGIHLRAREKKKILENRERFYIYTDMTQKVLKGPSLFFQDLFTPNIYSDKKIKIKNFILDFIGPHHLIVDVIRSFNEVFPIPERFYESECDDEVYFKETCLALEVIVYVISGVTDKDFLRTFVSEKRNLINNKNIIYMSIKNISPPIYQNEIITLYDVIKDHLSTITLFSQLLKFIEESTDDMEAA
jgi:hypothetical protein